MSTSVGIIGDGQLGMMLCEAAPALGIDTVMLTSNADCPAAQKADTAIEGAMDSDAAIAELIARSDVITYEREDVPEAAVALLRKAEQTGQVRCYPSLDIIELIQDKAKQKRWLADADLATLPFRIVNGERDMLDAGVQELGLPVVQKALRGGFDGRGVQVLRTEKDLEKAWPGETLLEQYAGSFREIAVLVARGQDGAIKHFGPVDMTFETDYSVLDTVIAPASISADTESTAIELAHRAIDSLNGVGVFGVEMFLLDDGQVLINEISPRVHNAGHYSIEACAHSQFYLHLQAVTGAALADTTLLSPASMRNLLCTPALLSHGKEHAAGVTPIDANTDTNTSTNTSISANVHWYGKSPARAMRKLGHITATAENATQAHAEVDRLWQLIQEHGSI